MTSHPPEWWGGGRAKKASEHCKRIYGFTCWICGHPIDPDDYSVDHVIERVVRPDLTWDPSNWRPAHRTKKPQWQCPGNSGRSNQAKRPEPPITTWTSSTW